MKNFLLIGALCLLSGCVPVPVNSVMNACPAQQDIAGYVFYKGPPPAGTEIPPATINVDAVEWRLDGEAYLQCRYKDGSIVLQKLPSNIDRCRARGTQLTCTAWL